MKEKYLKIDPDGSISWIELDRLPRHDDIYCGAEAISLLDLHPIIGCDCVEMVRTIIPGVVMIVDESGKIKYPMQDLNPKASVFYAGSRYGVFIHGPAVFFGTSMGPEGEDLVPLNDWQQYAVHFELASTFPFWHRILGIDDSIEVRARTVQEQYCTFFNVDGYTDCTNCIDCELCKKNKKLGPWEYCDDYVLELHMDPRFEMEDDSDDD